MNTTTVFGAANREGISVSRRGRTQNWFVGAVVSVGFCRNLTVTGCGEYQGWTEWQLVSDKGVRYTFSQADGLNKVR